MSFVPRLSGVAWRCACWFASLAMSRVLFSHQLRFACSSECTTSIPPTAMLRNTHACTFQRRWCFVTHSGFLDTTNTTTPIYCGRSRFLFSVRCDVECFARRRRWVDLAQRYHGLRQSCSSRDPIVARVPCFTGIIWPAVIPCRSAIPWLVVIVWVAGSP